MQKKVYTIIKKIPGFMYPVNTEFHVLNDEVYVNTKEHIYSSLKRAKEFDGFDFYNFVKSNYMKMEYKQIEDYQIGMLVVYNEYGCDVVDNTFRSNDVKPKNHICKISSNPILTNIDNVKVNLSDVYTGVKYENVNVKKLYCKTASYWFIDSHGKIQMTYFWLRPKDDRYRIASNNVFHSFDEAEAARDKIKEFTLTTQLKDFTDEW